MQTEQKPSWNNFGVNNEKGLLGFFMASTSAHI